MNKKEECAPLITVLMSVYNGERWLPECIQSVLEQTFTNLEFIIINDGSDDSSLQIISHFAKKDSRICFYDRRNYGLTNSLNYGIAKAQGEWIARIDADDIWSSNKLQKQIECIQMNTSFVLVGSGLFLIDENSNQCGVYIYPKQHSRLTRRLSRNSAFFAHSSALFKLSTMKKLGGYRAQFKRSQDQDLWLRLTEIGKITCIKQPLVQIRKHIDQISLDKSGESQSLYSFIAMTSYNLRKMGEVDPIETNEKEKIDAFCAFILQRLKDNFYFEYQRFADELKKSVSNVETRYEKFNILVKYSCFKPVFAFRYFKYRLFGSSLPAKFARDWVNYS